MTSPAIERGGIRVEPPTGCEARIRQRPVAPASAATRDGEVAAAAAAAEADGGVERPVVHVSTAALPADRGDFGSGVVETMRGDDVLVVLVELDPSQAGSALVQREGMPRSIPASSYSPDSMQRTIHGQSGTQVFFAERGRAFCIYAVLGNHARRDRLAPEVDRILSQITVLDG